MEVEKVERSKENANSKFLQAEKDLQMTIKAEQQSHEDDVERLAKEMVNVKSGNDNQFSDAGHTGPTSLKA